MKNPLRYLLGRGEESEKDVDNESIESTTDDEEQSGSEETRYLQYTHTFSRTFTQKKETIHFVRGDPLTISYDEKWSFSQEGIEKVAYYRGYKSVSIAARPNRDRTWTPLARFELEDPEKVETVIAGNITHITREEGTKMRVEQDVTCYTAYPEGRPEEAQGKIGNPVGPPRIYPVDD